MTTGASVLTEDRLGDGSAPAVGDPGAPVRAEGAANAVSTLGSIGNTASSHNNESKSLNNWRFVRQAAARELLPHRPVAYCLRRPVPEAQAIEVWKPEQGGAYYRHLMTCDSIWECPVCAGKITERRRRALKSVLSPTIQIVVLDESGNEQTLTRPKYYLAMATFTLSHRAPESCWGVLKRVQRAYKRMWSGRFAQSFKQRHSIIGTLRAIEPTHGDSGWHPHIHTLFISDSPITGLQEVTMLSELRDAWVHAVSKAGGYATAEHGVDLITGDEAVGAYIVKMGNGDDEGWTISAEMTKYPTKRGRDGMSLWQLLDAYIAGDVAAGELWLEGVGAMKGTRHIAPSPGLWEKLGIESLDDYAGEMGGEEALGQKLAEMPLEAWQVIIRHDLRGELLARANAGSLRAFFAELGIDIVLSSTEANKFAGDRGPPAQITMFLDDPDDGILFPDSESGL